MRKITDGEVIDIAIQSGWKDELHGMVGGMYIGAVRVDALARLLENAYNRFEKEFLTNNQIVDSIKTNPQTERNW